MATELKDYIRVYDDVADRSFCTSVMRAFDIDIPHQSYIDREMRPTFTELNMSQRYLEKDSTWVPLQEKMQQIFTDYVNLYMEDLGIAQDFPAKYAFEQYRVKKYIPKINEFRDHVDVQDYSSARRFLVCFLYLNDVEIGGETAFPKLDYQIKPKCGRLLIFPPTWQYRHAGRPTEVGSKYIVGSYLHYL